MAVCFLQPGSSAWGRRWVVFQGSRRKGERVGIDSVCKYLTCGAGWDEEDGRGDG